MLRKFEEISTKTLDLVELNEEMIDSIFIMMANRFVMQYTGIDVHESKKETEMWIDDRKQEAEDKREYTWAIKLKSDVVVGWISAKDCSQNSYLITCVEDSQFWRFGYMTEALNQIIQYLFSRCDAEHVIGGCHPDNKRSENLMRKVGMHRVWLDKVYFNTSGEAEGFQHVYSIDRFKL